MKYLIGLALLALCFAQTAKASCVLQIQVDSAITVATDDYIGSAIDKAQKQDCSSILVLMNTPGGNLQSTRFIVERILASPVPFLCLISPQGAHAGSAGAIIMEACHVNGALKATNIGAATPILGTGEKLSDDLRNKMVNDTVSWLQGIAKLRGRNLKFAEDIVTSAKALESEEAQKQGALDFVVDSKEEFLQKAAEKEVTLQNKEKQKVIVGEIKEYPPEVRHLILNFLADPEFTYLLFMASLVLLYFEITHPGFIAPGVIGGMGLILSLIAFHKMNVMWGGFALILLGIGLLIAEVYVTSFGALAIGGFASFVIGSLLLFNNDPAGYHLSVWVVLAVGLIFAGIVLGLSYLALSTFRRKTKTGQAFYIGTQATVVTLEADQKSGQVEVLGEIWRFQSKQELQLKEQVMIEAVQGLTLTVRKKEDVWKSEV